MSVQIPLPVCVLGGCSDKALNRHLLAAGELGTALGQLSPRLIYGSRGLGQAVASAGASAGAKVTEVVPYAKLGEHGPPIKGAEVQVVRSAHEQNKLMYFLADAIVAMPGGLETLGALTEMITWRDDSRPGKPIVLFDSGDYFPPLVSVSDHLVAEGFVTAKELSQVHYATSAQEVCELLIAWHLCQTSAQELSGPAQAARRQLVLPATER